MEVSRVRRTFERRVVAPVLARLLASPLHWPVSEWLAVVVLERDGDRVAVPVSYHCEGDEVYVVARRDGTDWWSAFREGARCRVVLAGERRRATAELETDAITHRQHVSDFLHPAGAFAGSFGDGSLGSADFTKYVLVRFSLD